MTDCGEQPVGRPEVWLVQIVEATGSTCRDAPHVSEPAATFRRCHGSSEHGEGEHRQPKATVLGLEGEQAREDGQEAKAQADHPAASIFDERDARCRALGRFGEGVRHQRF
jgi:hypothetical protein